MNLLGYSRILRSITTVALLVTFALLVKDPNIGLAISLIVQFSLIIWQTRIIKRLEEMK